MKAGEWGQTFTNQQSSEVLLSAGKGYLRATFFATFYSFGVGGNTPGIFQVHLNH
jgi:hypothetical protein